MAKAPKDYAKLYKAAIIQTERDKENIFDLRKEVQYNCKTYRPINTLLIFKKLKQWKKKGPQDRKCPQQTQLA